jgi:RNA polymerase sigma-70 factor (ECF subfamily)
LPIESAISREASDQYEAALGRLKPQEREAVIMRLELGLSYEDIGDVLGKSTVNAARMTVVRALERLIRDMSVMDEPRS